MGRVGCRVVGRGSLHAGDELVLAGRHVQPAALPPAGSRAADDARRCPRRASSSQPCPAAERSNFRQSQEGGVWHAVSMVSQPFRRYVPELRGSYGVLPRAKAELRVREQGAAIVSGIQLITSAPCGARPAPWLSCVWAMGPWPCRHCRRGPSKALSEVRACAEGSRPGCGCLQSRRARARVPNAG